MHGIPHCWENSNFATTKKVSKTHKTIFNPHKKDYLNKVTKCRYLEKCQEMYFSFSNTIHKFFFKDINVVGISDLVAACATFFFSTFLLEGTKVVMLYWTTRLDQHPLTYGQTEERSQDLSPLFLALRIPSSLESVKRKRLKFHFCGLLTHTFNVFLGYIIMLAVMQYNGYILLAVLAGSGLGYFIFGALGHSIQQKYAKLNVFEDKRDTSHINSSFEDPVT